MNSRQSKPSPPLQARLHQRWAPCGSARAAVFQEKASLYQTQTVREGICPGFSLRAPSAVDTQLVAPEGGCHRKSRGRRGPERHREPNTLARVWVPHLERRDTGAETLSNKMMYKTIKNSFGKNTAAGSVDGGLRPVAKGRRGGQHTLASLCSENVPVAGFLSLFVKRIWGWSNCEAGGTPLPNYPHL